MLKLAVAALICLVPFAGRTEKLDHPGPWLAFMLLAGSWLTQPREPEGQPRSAAEKRSLLFITLGSVGTVLAAVLELRLRENAVVVAHWVLAVGVLLAALGFALRLWAIAALGRHFTSSLSVAKEQRLVDSGPYRWVRHPAFSGVLLSSLGLCLALGSYFGPAIALLLLLPAYLYRARLEEAHLAAVLGEPYTAYQRRTRALIPFLL